MSIYATDAGAWTLDLKPQPGFGIRSAANSVTLPEPEPRAMSQLFVVRAIRRREVAEQSTLSSIPAIVRYRTFPRSGWFDIDQSENLQPRKPSRRRHFAKFH